MKIVAFICSMLVYISARAAGPMLFAGTGKAGFSGDGGPAVQAELITRMA